MIERYVPVIGVDATLEEKALFDAMAAHPAEAKELAMLPRKKEKLVNFLMGQVLRREPRLPPHAVKQRISEMLDAP